jgi:hypothetical protein
VGGSGREHGRVLRAAGQLDAGDVARGLDVEAGAREYECELVAERVIERGKHDRGAMLERVGRMGWTGECRDGARLHPLGRVGRRERAERRHEPLRDHEHAGALRDVAPVRCERGRQVARGHGEADKIVDCQLQLGGVARLDALRQHDTRQVALVLTLALQRLGLLARAATKLYVDPRARKRDCERSPPRARSNDRSPAQRRDPAKPLPLQHHARPNAIGDGLRQLA